MLAESIAGELIPSEIEIRSGRGEDLAAAMAAQRDRRRRLFALAAEHGVALGATGTHPWSDYREQKIIETEHYRRVEDGLKYVAWRNNTFSLHVHVGIRGADRAVLVCDRLRPVLPLLLAISANSPFLDGRDSGLHSARTQIFTKSFPRCGSPGRVRELGCVRRRTSSSSSGRGRSSSTRRCGGRSARTSRSGRSRCGSATRRSTAAESEGARRADRRVRGPGGPGHRRRRPVRRTFAGRLIEENLWRAMRYGLDGELLDLERGEPYPAAEALDRLLEWSAPARAELGIEVALPALNGAQRQRRCSNRG